MTMRAKPDTRIAVSVDHGSIACAHMIGRLRRGESVELFGALWRIVAITNRDGQRRFEFEVERPYAEYDRMPAQMMCWQCGSFRVDQCERDDPWYCQDCGSRDVEGAPPVGGGD